MTAPFQVEIAPTGYESLSQVRDKKLRHEIAKAIDGLGRLPEEQGKLLLPPLERVRSLTVLRGRFRILYTVRTEKRLVSVLLVGERKAGQEDDVYVLARKLLKVLSEGR